MLTDVEILESPEAEASAIDRYIRAQYDGRRPLEILEAGCGRGWPQDLAGIPFRLTGVDINADSLAQRRQRHGDLDEAIVGDLRTVDLGGRQFDIIYSAFVLEHVADAETALHNLAGALAPDGLMIIRIPDRDTAHGFVTRVSPHWFHVLYAKHIVGFADAGKPGRYPYPTVYDPVVSRAGIRRFCSDSGLELVDEFATCTYRGKTGPGMRLIQAGAFLVSLGSAGALDWRYNNVAFVLRRRAALAKAA
jgi:SAM-dependent methyltransferase